jgi:uracil-DNA glycosylase
MSLMPNSKMLVRIYDILYRFDPAAHALLPISQYATPLTEGSSCALFTTPGRPNISLGMKKLGNVHVNGVLYTPTKLEAPVELIPAGAMVLREAALATTATAPVDNKSKVDKAEAAANVIMPTPLTASEPTIARAVMTILDEIAAARTQPTATVVVKSVWTPGQLQAMLYDNTWYKLLADEFEQPYMARLCQLLTAASLTGTQIFPPHQLVFAALNQTRFNNVKVVIIGQDPYHDNDQAEGLAFSVPEAQPVPSSLRNIFKEIASDIEDEKETVIARNGHLSRWTEQGVLLLNTCLTVTAHQPNSHKSFGWEQFTNAIIVKLNSEKQGLVFLLWGAHAQKKASSIDAKKHHVLKAAHPSGLSAHRGFFGCKHFSQCNALLKAQKQTPIVW